jgi:hypothetical protein
MENLSCSWKISGKDSPIHSRPGVGESILEGNHDDGVADDDAAELPLDGVVLSWARSDAQKSSKPAKTKTAARFTTI